MKFSLRNILFMVIILTMTNWSYITLSSIVTMLTPHSMVRHKIMSEIQISIDPIPKCMSERMDE
jgi:hypothetical protein